MAKATLEDVLRARMGNTRALRGAIIIQAGKPVIVFGAIGEHRRFSVTVDGDEMTLNDDPREDEAEDAPESDETAPAADADKSAGKPPEKPQDADKGERLSPAERSAKAAQALADAAPEGKPA